MIPNPRASLNPRRLNLSKPSGHSRKACGSILEESYSLFSQSKHRSVDRLVIYTLPHPGQVTGRRPLFLGAGPGRSSGGRLVKGSGTHVHVGSSSTLATSCSFGLFVTSLMTFPPLTNRRSSPPASHNPHQD